MPGLGEKSVLATIKGYFVGCSYGLLWYGSILLGFYFLYAPLLPLIFLNRELYRLCTDTLYSSWEAFNVSLLQGVYGVKLVLTGDDLHHNENALIVLNHPTRTDWNFLWQGLFHAGPNHNAKIILKDQLRKIPGMGWVMAMSRFIYLKRTWSSDAKILDSMIDYFSIIRNEGGKQLVLFPEGTNITETSKKRSDAYAMKNNKPAYEYVLHPRTTGFVHLARGLMDKTMLDAVYDVTIAYPATKPLSESTLLSGDIPEQVNIHFVRHPLSTLPSTYIGLEKWLEERWRDKEVALESFYTKNTNFPALSHGQLQPRPLTVLQPLCLAGCGIFLVWSLHLLFTSYLAIFWVVLVTLVMVGLEGWAEGIQEMEIRLEKESKTAAKAVQECEEDFEHLKHE